MVADLVPVPRKPLMAQSVSPAGMGRFIVIVRLFCIVPFLTGIVDMLGGVWILQQAGAALPAKVADNAVLNNQIAFWGAIWFGFGIGLWWTSRAPLSRATVARILLAVLFLAGLARAYAAMRWGYPGAVMTGAMAIELILSPVLLAWLGWLQRGRYA